MTESELAKNDSIKIVGITDVIRLHSDKPYKGSTFEDHDPSELYPAFIDLYLLSYSSCVAYGKLGFGRLGARMSGEKCIIDTRNHQCKVE